MAMNYFSWTFLAALGISTLGQLWLILRHSKTIKDHRAHVPAEFAAGISLAEHQKAADYTRAKNQFSVAETLFGLTVLLLWTFGGGLNWLDQSVQTLQFGPLLTGTVVIVCFSLISSAINLPLSFYETFDLEERFGFNKTTLKLFVVDIVKNTLVASVIGIPMVLFILWIMELAGSLWWFYVWLVWIGFTALMFWLYPVVIAPLFNKFTPLEDETLVQTINALLQRCGFSNNGLFIMDGSRRSGHGNAYFTGFGSNKRIVFYDTLIHSLNNEEIEAVLAHELGHFKKKHVIKRLLSMVALSLATLALLGWLISQTWFYSGLGVHQVSNHMALLLFIVALPVFSFFIQPISAYILRKHEFEADAYAAQQSSAGHLIQALVKLYKENANTLTPDPLYSAFHDSHPPAPIRIAYLKHLANETVKPQNETSD